MTPEQELLERADHQLMRIQRYFDKQWMDDDYPTDAIDELLSKYGELIARSV